MPIICHPHGRNLCSLFSPSRIVEGDPGDGMYLQTTQIRLLVPSSQIGCVLGKGGAIITKLREESGAQIRVVGGDQVPRCALPTDEMVQVGRGQCAKICHRSRGCVEINGATGPIGKHICSTCK